MVERWHRRLKDALRARAAGPDWVLHLPWVLLALRTSPHEDTGISPAEAVFGAQLIVPGQFLDAPEPPSAPFLDALRAHVDRYHPAPPAHHNSPAALPPPVLPAALLSARMVLVRNDGHIPPLGALYSGPYKVLERSLHYFKLQIGTRTDTVSTHRLKAALLPDDAAAAEPPQRGRPRKPQPPPPPAPQTPPGAANNRVAFDLPPQPAAAAARRPVRNHRPPTPPRPATTANGRPVRNRRPPARFQTPF
jgi:hypothetical protein